MVHYRYTPPSIITDITDEWVDDDIIIIGEVVTNCEVQDFTIVVTANGDEIYSGTFTGPTLNITVPTSGVAIPTTVVTTITDNCGNVITDTQIITKVGYGARLWITPLHQGTLLLPGELDAFCVTIRHPIFTP
jgi:hypothetical protein